MCNSAVMKVVIVFICCCSTVAGWLIDGEPSPSGEDRRDSVYQQVRFLKRYSETLCVLEPSQWFPSVS